MPPLPWVGFFGVPEGELVAEAGQEGTLAGGQAGRWQPVGRPVQQGRAPGGQVGEAGVGVGLDPASVAGLGRQLFVELQPLRTGFEGHPWDWGAWRREAEASGRAWRGSSTSRWNPGKELSFTPLRPERVVEVRYDHLEGRRFRHTAQFQRWRPDRDPRSCTYDQLEETVSFDLAEVLAITAT
jgi:hypothetical protein